MTGSGDLGLGADEKLNPEDGLHHDAEKGEGMKKVIYWVGGQTGAEDYRHCVGHRTRIGRAHRSSGV